MNILKFVLIFYNFGSSSDTLDKRDINVNIFVGGPSCHMVKVTDFIIALTHSVISLLHVCKVWV